jgi:hypothetical protein
MMSSFTLRSLEPTAESGAPVPTARTRPALRPAPTAAWLLTLLIAAFYETRSELSRASGDVLAGAAIDGAVFAAVAARTAGHALEAAFYSGFWRVRDLKIGFAWMFVAVVSLSVLETLANATALLGADGSLPWLAPLVGVRAIEGALQGAPGLRLAFGSFGLLSVARLVGTAWAQSRDGAPWTGALRVTAAAWLAGRLATWWTADLLRGFSATG